MSSEPILSIEGNQATIRLNRPQHHNRIEVGDIAVLHDMFSQIERDTRVRVLVLTASGPTFSAGYDLQALAIEVSENRVPAFDKMVDHLESLSQPSVHSTAALTKGVAISRLPAIFVSELKEWRC